MSRYAVVHENVVTNIVEWDGVSEWSPSAGEVQDIGDDICSIGWIKTPAGLRPSPESNVPRKVREPAVTEILDELILVLNASGIPVTKASLTESARVTLREKFKDVVDFPQFK